jgi:predicted nucleic acid-binding protein
MHQSPAERQSTFFPSANSGENRVRRYVLDTNVVLDLLVFHDPRCQPLADELERGSCRWYATTCMRAEFDAVLGRPAFTRWHAQRDLFALQFARWAALIDPAALPEPALRCGDSDDQMFLDLAVALRPCALLTRDHELLRLARAAAALGVQIATPAQIHPG